MNILAFNGRKILMWELNPTKFTRLLTQYLLFGLVQAMTWCVTVLVTRCVTTLMFLGALTIMAECLPLASVPGS